MSTFNEEVLARKKEAMDKRIEDKAWVIAIAMGKECPKTNPREATRRTFSHGKLKIFTASLERDFSEGSVTSLYVTYRGKKVFEENDGEIKSYIPGVWEKKLIELCLPIVLEVIEIKKAILTAASAEVRKKFGL